MSLFLFDHFLEYRNWEKSHDFLEEWKQKKCFWDYQLSDSYMFWLFVHSEKHGLRTPIEAFFNWNQNFWAWADKLGRWIPGHFGSSFGQTTKAHLDPCPYFPLFNHYLKKKSSLPIHIHCIYLGLGFKFGRTEVGI